MRPPPMVTRTLRPLVAPVPNFAFWVTVWNLIQLRSARTSSQETLFRIPGGQRPAGDAGAVVRGAIPPPPHGNAPRGWSQSVPTTRLTPPDARRRLAAVVRNRHPAPLRPKTRFRSNHGSRTPGHDLPQAAVISMARNRNLLGYGAHAPASNTDLISNQRKFQQFQHFSSGRKFLQFQQCLRVCYSFQQSCHVTKLTAENRRRFAPKYAHICV